jgi:hypothetical protein
LRGVDQFYQHLDLGGVHVAEPARERCGAPRTALAVLRLLPMGERRISAAARAK